MAIWGGVVHLDGCRFEDNSAPNNSAGAIYTYEGAVIDDTDFVSNTALGGGGVIWLQSGTGSAISNSSFNGNASEGSGAKGGAILNNATLEITASTFTQNSGTGEGGAIFSDGIATVVNSTFDGNTSGVSGGAVAQTGTLSAINNTFSGNGQPSGGSIDAGGTTHLINNIVANSTNGDDCAGTLATNTNNLVEDNTCSPTLSGDPMLGAMEYTGLGGTGVFPLLAGSPAIDAGDAASAPANDQRGETRDAQPDIGAYESQSQPPIAITPTTTDGTVPGTAIDYTISATGQARAIFSLGTTDSGLWGWSNNFPEFVGQNVQTLTVTFDAPVPINRIILGVNSVSTSPFTLMVVGAASTADFDLSDAISLYGNPGATYIADKSSPRGECQQIYRHHRRTGRDLFLRSDRHPAWRQPESGYRLGRPTGGTDPHSFRVGIDHVGRNPVADNDHRRQKAQRYLKPNPNRGRMPFAAPSNPKTAQTGRRITCFKEILSSLTGLDQHATHTPGNELPGYCLTSLTVLPETDSQPRQ